MGLTGGIGSGKTTVGKLFQEFDIPLYIADTEAKRLMNTPEIIAQVKNLLGDRSYVNQTLDRAYVADQVFNDNNLLEQLNAIVHPAVAQHFKQWCNEVQGPYLIKEAAILFENGSYRDNYRNILVTAPEEMRIRRVMERDATTQEKIKARMQKQWTDDEKRKLADYTIENIELKKTREEVQKIHVKIMGSLVNS